MSLLLWHSVPAQQGGVAVVRSRRPSAFRSRQSCPHRTIRRPQPFPDLARNGRQTLTENIADLGGLSAAYDAYRASLTGNAPIQNGFTGDQQFFLSFAQMWASKSTEASLRQQVMTDTHPPDQFRPATVRNLDAWYAAFDVKPGDKLYLAPADRVRIW